MSDASRVTPSEALSTLLDDVARRVAINTRTMVPAVVVSFARSPRAEVSVQVQMLARLRTGETVQIPQVDRVPVVWPAGGGWVMDADLEPGDQVMLQVFDRDISTWLADGDLSAPQTGMLHSLSSSACAAVSLRSESEVAEAVPGTGAMLIGRDSGLPPWVRMFSAGPPRVVLEAPSIELGDGATAGVARLAEPVRTAIVPAALPIVTPNPADPWSVWFLAVGVGSSAGPPPLTSPIGWISTASTVVKSK